MMSDRDHRRAEFLAGAGWGRARLDPIPGDASARHYFRLADRGRRAILMDGAPDRFDARPFFKIARLLHGLDYSAPLILATDPDGGFAVLEDLGDDSFARLLDAGADERALYGLATDLLADLHDRFDLAAAHGVPAYSEAILLEEIDRFPLWFLPAATGLEAAPEQRAEFAALWRSILPLARAVPDSLVLRDYFPGNLMRLAERPGLGACGLIDFQDAVLGPAAYDLVSLSQDARIDVAEPLELALLARYIKARRAAEEGFDPAEFAELYAIMSAQRNTRLLGTFARLNRRDGKPQYLRHQPRIWTYLSRSLAHPGLARLRQWYAANIPAPLA